MLHKILPATPHEQSWQILVTQVAVRRVGRHHDLVQATVEHVDNHNLTVVCKACNTEDSIDDRVAPAVGTQGGTTGA